MGMMLCRGRIFDCFRMASCKEESCWHVKSARGRSRSKFGLLRPLLSVEKTVPHRNRRLKESISAINCCCCCRFFWQRWWITVDFGDIIALLSFLWTNCYINLTALAASAIAYTSSKVSLVFWSAEGDTRKITLSSNSQESKSWLNVKTTSNLKFWY